MITDIQKFSIHDGKGTRTTVFFKGCPLRCAWCHNPETQSYGQQLYFYEERCRGCNSCRNVCRYQAAFVSQRCVACGACVPACNYSARKMCGRDPGVDELVAEIMKDEPFYEASGGGVTLSGGEVLSTDMDYLQKLMQALYRNGISVNIDTCGYVSFERIEKVIPYTDTFLYDIKLTDPEEHLRYTGVDNRLIIDNLIRLSRSKADIWIRLPIIGGVNDHEGHVKAVAELLKENDISYSRISLLPYHNTGSSKYGRIGSEYPGKNFYTPEAAQMQLLKDKLTEAGLVNVYVG
ncbi:MAG: glycyl-radical enzyme activating protein [Eubacterium sp.]|nr:glycyl-radical enzyme activating protein [Eubacterium sp.]